MRHRRLITLLVLAMWVLAGPLVLVCGSHCTSMGMACASLCAPTPGALSTLPSLTLLPHSTVPLQRLALPLTPSVKVPTPPPKNLSFIA